MMLGILISNNIGTLIQLSVPQIYINPYLLEYFKKQGLH